MTIALIVLVVLVAIAVVTVWLIKRKLASMADGLPDTLQQWEKEMEKLEKPKG
jgi:cell division protein FtsL